MRHIFEGVFSAVLVRDMMFFVVVIVVACFPCAHDFLFLKNMNASKRRLSISDNYKTKKYKQIFLIILHMYMLAYLLRKIKIKFCAVRDHIVKIIKPCIHII
jgi:hypothetical protein